MTVRRFVDTNLLLYADDPRDPRKQAIALQLVAGLIAAGTGVVSTQVLQEYYANAVGKLGLEPHLARDGLERFALMTVVQVDVPLILDAIDLHRAGSIAFWDALIVRAAAAAGCAELLSEDLPHGTRLAGVRVVNPFAG
jgi:predicted nucleic acid-binding protein